MKRVYLESVKKWAIGAGVTGATAITLILAYLYSAGAIAGVQFSGDVYCAGTVEDPCYAYINFTAEDDIYIYPLQYDPYGRNTPFEFSPAIKEWKLERSWGKGWREIDLTQEWSKIVKYSVKFSKGTTYNLRITVLKNNPTDTIKWGAFGIDPYFLPPLTPIESCDYLEWEEIETTYEPFEKVIPCPTLNKTCTDTTTVTEYKRVETLVRKSKCTPNGKVQYGDKVYSEEGKWFIVCGNEVLASDCTGDGYCQYATCDNFRKDGSHGKEKAIDVVSDKITIFDKVKK